MLFMLLSPIQLQETTQIVDTGVKSIEKINDPILQILIMVLILAIVALATFFIKYFKAKERELKNINDVLLTTTATDLKLIFEFETTIEHYVNQNKSRENYVKKNYEILKDIKKQLDCALKNNKDD